MPKWDKKSGELAIKVAVIGQPGSGKGNILRHVASLRDQSAVRTGLISGAEVVRTEFIWHDPIPDGPFVRVRVLALSGNPLHQAAEQLLLVDCDALVFVVDCDPARVAGSRDCLVALMSNADYVGLNWDEAVVVMQYNHAEKYPQLNPGELDEWLGIGGARVERFVTASNDKRHLGVAVDAAIREVIARISGQESGAGA